MVLLFTMIAMGSHAQGDLDYLKDNVYLKHYYDRPFDCDTLRADGVSSLEDRICANLRLQRADSVLKVYHDSVRVEMLRYEGEVLVESFDLLQDAWRYFRDTHCNSLYGGYGTSTGAVLYMDEMRRLTEIRIAEMKGLLRVYRGY